LHFVKKASKKQHQPGDFKFTSALFKKLNDVAIRNRVIERNLHPLANERIERSNSSDFSDVEEPNLSECAQMDSCVELDVPQQLWDEMFESALSAVGHAAVADIFDSN
jgi:hypothetical protein